MKVAFAVLLCFFSLNACATTGNELLRQLRSPDASESLHGFAYISGVVDTEYLYYAVNTIEMANDKNIKSLRYIHFCIPKDVTMGQVVDIVIKKLEAEPEKRHETANLIIRRALVATFPCKENAVSIN